MTDIKSRIPNVNGRIRKESFGGIYYERDRLTIELLNETAFDILNFCNGSRSVDDVEKQMISIYNVSPEVMKNDMDTYISYLLQSKFIDLDGILPKENERVFPGTIRMEQPKQENHVLGLPPFVLSAPLKVLLELTYNCNLKCVHCFADAEYCKKSEQGYIEGELTAEQWYRVIDHILDANVFEILLSGGEATMRKDLLDIAGYIQNKGAQYCLLSNTTLIDDVLARGLKETGCVKVESNLDGYNAKTYDSFRGVPGAFQATVNGIQACLRNGLQVRCNVMETKQTIFNLREIVKTAYKIGVREVCVVPLESGGRAQTNDHLAFQYDEMEELDQFYRGVNEWFEEEYAQTGMVLLTPYSLKKESNSPYAKVFDLNDFMPQCGAGKIHCTVNPYGEVKLCPADHGVLNLEHQSLVKTSLRKIWQTSPVLNAIRGREFQKCHSCKNDRCGYSCPVTRLQEQSEWECKYVD